MCLCRPDTSLVPEVFIRSSQTKLSYEARAKSPEEAREQEREKGEPVRHLSETQRNQLAGFMGHFNVKCILGRPKADGRGGQIRRVKSVRARGRESCKLSLAPISPVLSAHPDYLPLGLRERVKWRL